MSPLVPYTKKGESFDFSPAPEPELQSLLYSAGNTIRLHNYADGKEYLIARRKDPVFALTVHKGRIYDSCFNRIHVNLSGKSVAARQGGTLSLASCQDRLFDAGHYNLIYDTMANAPVAKRERDVFALAVHEAELYDAGQDGKIHKTETGEVIGDYGTMIRGLASCEGELYAIVECEIFENSRGRAITKRLNVINAFADYNGRLIDGGRYDQIIDTLSGEPIIEVGDIQYGVQDLVPIDQKLADRLMQRKGVEKIK
jgi:hypothetical protein